MDGAEIKRIEIDSNEDGKIDRWEHYESGKVTSVGSSSRGDGIEDQFAYPGADGGLSRVETDTDRDGKIDKWETYSQPIVRGGPLVLRSVETEPDASGKPTFRLLYKADGTFDRAERVK